MSKSKISLFGLIGLAVAAPFIRKALKKIPALKEVKDNFSSGAPLDSSGDVDASHR